MSAKGSRLVGDRRARLDFEDGLRELGGESGPDDLICAHPTEHERAVVVPRPDLGAADRGEAASSVSSRS